MPPFSRTDADVFIPDGSKLADALARTTHLGVGAHQDDLEVIALEGILACYEQPGLSFTGVVVTDGAGSPRTGPFSDYTGAQMKEVRREEQRQAAQIGKFGCQLQLGHSSAGVKDREADDVREDLRAIFVATQPEVLYLHNPADKHDTHVALLLRCIEALRLLPMDQRPVRVLGVEAWRDLDWLLDEDKVALDVSARPELSLKLISVFQSQIAGGKRYDIAAPARRQAHATFHHSHEVDAAKMLNWALDLTPLVEDDDLTIDALVEAHLTAFVDDVRARLAKF